MTRTTPPHLVAPAAAALMLHILSLHLAAAQSPGEKGTTIQGYTFETDVSNHARIDLDQKRMEETTDAGEWSDAGSIYKNGKNSGKEGKLRSLAGFSTEADTKMSGEGYFRLYKAYWDDHGDYANRFVQSGLDGSGDIAGKPIKFRAEIANKGSQYQNVWMYIIHEMEDAIDDCKKNNLNDNDSAVKAWDEAWAFYTGSLVANLTSGDDGVLQYTLAQLRCADFGTCKKTSSRTEAKVNEDAVALFNRGQSELNNRQCNNAIAIKNDIVKLMTVPLMQGTIRYVYLTKDAAEEDDEREKNHAEGWAFSAAMLPLVHNCDKGVAKMLRKNFEPKNNPMSDDPADVVSKLSTVYRCLGFTCGDVGKLATQDDYPKCEESGPQFKVVPGTEVPAGSNEGSSVFNKLPSGSDSGGLSGGAIAGIIIGVLLAVTAVVGLYFYRKSKKPKVVPALVPEGESGQDVFV